MASSALTLLALRGHTTKQCVMDVSAGNNNWFNGETTELGNHERNGSWKLVRRSDVPHCASLSENFVRARAATHCQHRRTQSRPGP